MNHMNHYVANVCRIGADLAMGQIVPTDESYDRLDDSRPVMDFFQTAEGDWKASRFHDLRTGDRGRAPSCFAPRQEIIEALNKAAEIAEQTQHGIAHAKFTIEN